MESCSHSSLSSCEIAALKLAETQRLTLNCSENPFPELIGRSPFHHLNWNSKLTADFKIIEADELELEHLALG